MSFHWKLGDRLDAVPVIAKASNARIGRRRNFERSCFVGVQLHWVGNRAGSVRELVKRADGGYMVRVMRAALRLLMCLATSASIAVAVVPAQAAVPQVKAGCCAKMRMDAPASDCGHHAPNSNQEKECCAGCVFCLAILVRTIPLLYPPTGGESFATVAVHEHVRSHRPPVPPPRA